MRPFFSNQFPHWKNIPLGHTESEYLFTR